MKIAMVTRDLEFGMGVHTAQLARAMIEVGLEVDVYLGGGNFKTNIIASKIDGRGYDVIHIHGSPFGALGNTKTPRVVTVHSLLKTELKYEWSMSYWLGVPFEEGTFKKARKIIAVSPVVAWELEYFYGIPRDKVVVIPNAVDFSELERVSVPRANEKFAFSCGRLVKRKDFATFKRACELKNIPYRLHHGEVTRKELIKTYKQASVFVMPSLYESFGIVLLEAMACRTPVVSSDIDAARMLVFDGVTGLLFKPGDAEELSEKISLIIEDKELAEKLAGSAYKFVRSSYSWDTVVRQTIRVYEGVT